jgi:hypothetical protein
VLSNGRMTISGSTELAPGGVPSALRTAEKKPKTGSGSLPKTGVRLGFSSSATAVMTLQSTPLGVPLQEGSTAWWMSPTERRDYDAMGRLTQVSTFFDVGQLEYSSAGTLSVGGWMKHATVFVYDNDGRMVRQLEYGRADGDWGAGVVSSGQGTLAAQSQVGSLSSLSDNNITFNANGTVHDRSVTNLAWEDGQKPSGVPDYFVQWYAYTYLQRDSYLEQTITGSSNVAGFKPANSTSGYDAYNRLMNWGESSPTPGFTPRARYYGYDLEGQILIRREGRWTGDRNTGQSTFPTEQFGSPGEG